MRIKPQRRARLAEAAGIRALAVHGRTREQRYNGFAEYDTIAEINAAVGIPVFANGDIDTPAKAAEVLDYTGADAVMVGRGAQGNPWIFREIDHFLRTGEILPPVSLDERRRVMREHLDALHGFYGEHMGARIARKHIGWYLATREDAKPLRQRFNALDSAEGQRCFVDELFRRATAPATEGISAA